MSLLQIKKPTFHIILAFLVIALLSFNIHVQAENTEKRDKAQTLWEEGTDICNSVNIAFSEKGYQPALKKFNDSLALYKEIGDKQSEADVLTWIAKVYMDIGDSSKFAYAKNCLEQAQYIYNELNSSPGTKASIKDIDACMEAMLLYITGESCQDNGDYNSALEKFNAALQILSEIGDRFYEARILNKIGSVYRFDLESYSEAELYYQEALMIFRELGKEGYEGRVLSSLGTVCHYKHLYPKALEYLDKALKIFEQFDDKYGMLFVLLEKGHICLLQHDYSKALKFYKKAQAIFQDIRIQGLAATIVSFQGIANQRMGYLNIPVKHYEQALDIIQKTGNRPREAGMLFTVGQLYSSMGDYEEALKPLNRALQIYNENGDRNNQGQVLVEIGKVNTKIGNYTKAIDNLQKALKEFEEVKDSNASKRLALSTLGSVYRLLGDDETAKEYDKEYDLENKGTDKADKNTEWEQYMFLMGQGLFFLKENKNDKVLEVINKLLELSKENDEKRVEERCLKTIGVFYQSLREYKKTIDFHKQALEVNRTHTAKDEELFNLLSIADTYNYPCLSDYPNALDYYGQALTIATEIGDKPSEGRCLSSIGQIYFVQMNDIEAEEYLKKALLVSSEMGAQEKIWQAQKKLGRFAYFAGDMQKAKSYYSEAINTIESIRGKISVEEYKTSFIEDKLSVYTDLIYLLLDLKEDEEAFNYVERAKSRSLLDLLGNRVKLDKGKGKELSKEERRLQKKINELLEKIRKEQSQPKGKQKALIKEWNEELEQTRKKYTDLLINIKQEDPELYSLVNVNPLTLKEVQALIDPDTTLIEYYHSGRSIIYWVIDRNTHKAYITSAPNLASKISTFREKIFTLQSDYDNEAEELYDLLIRPAKPYIKTKRICIVPHSVLHYLPFQALINTDEAKNKPESQTRFLIEEYDIFYAPSASVLKFVLEKRKKVSGKVLAFGNPELDDKKLNLPYAEDELKRIKESYPDTSIYMNEEATEEKVKQLSGNYDIIHFASHGELNPESPLFSSIRLAKEKDEDGRLEVHEIFNLDLENTSLVTLSACETGLGKLSKGDELIGLTRAFIYAGTPSIVASLWSVNDKSTSDLMGLFYKNLKTHSKVEALRMAQREMINGEVGRGIVRGVGGITTSIEGEDNPQSQMTINGSHPYFWAPFILLGDWK